MEKLATAKDAPQTASSSSAPPLQTDVRYASAEEQEAARRRLQLGRKRSSANKIRRVEPEPSSGSQPGTRGTARYDVTQADWDARQAAKAAARVTAEAGKGQAKAPPPPRDRPSQQPRGPSPHARHRPYSSWKGDGKGQEKGRGKGQRWLADWWESPSDWSGWTGTGWSPWQEPGTRGGYHTRRGDYRDYY